MWRGFLCGDWMVRRSERGDSSFSDQILHMGAAHWGLALLGIIEAVLAVGPSLVVGLAVDEVLARKGMTSFYFAGGTISALTLVELFLSAKVNKLRERSIEGLQSVLLVSYLRAVASARAENLDSLSHRTISFRCGLIDQIVRARITWLSLQITSPLLIFLSLVCISWINLRVGVLFFGLSSLLIAFLLSGRRRMAVAIHRTTKVGEAYSGEFASLLTAAGILKKDLSVRWYVSRVAELALTWRSERRKGQQTILDLSVAVTCFQRAALIGLLILGGLEMGDGRLSVGGFFAISFLARQSSIVLQRFVPLCLDAASHRKTAETLEETLETLRDDNFLQPDACRTAFSEIVCDDLSFFYPAKDRAAVSGCSFRLSKGARLAVVGPSGAGKSTLAKLLSGEYAPTTGKLLVVLATGEMIEAHKARSRVSYIASSSIALKLTIREYLRLGNMEASDDLIWSMLERVGLRAAVSERESGISTPLGEFGWGVSTGQAQRLALAQGLLSEPDILILDEITSGLDPIAEWTILGLLKEVSEDTLIVLVSHRMESIRICTHVAVVEDGVLTFVGGQEDAIRRSSYVRKCLYVRG